MQTYKERGEEILHMKHLCQWFSTFSPKRAKSRLTTLLESRTKNFNTSRLTTLLESRIKNFNTSQLTRFILLQNYTNYSLLHKILEVLLKDF